MLREIFLRINNRTTPLEAAHITWLVLWGLWVIIGANNIPDAYYGMYAWAEVRGYRGGAGAIPITLGLTDLVLATMSGKKPYRARWVVNASAAFWWMTCVIFFAQTSFWHTSTPSYTVAAMMAFSVAWLSRERIEVPSWKISASSN